MKRLFVRDLHSLANDSTIEAEFAIKGVQLCSQKDGGRHLSFELMDVTGGIKAKWWNRDESHCQTLEAVRYGRVFGNVNDYQQKRSIIVTKIDDLGVPGDLSDFEAVAALPVTELTRRLEAHVASIRNPHLTSLLGLVFKDAELRRSFENAPAAMKNHHACRHGLLQHTVEVTDIAAAVAEVQKTWGYESTAERDLVVAGALLHDIGKVYELRWGDHATGYTRRGQLLGHITLGTQAVAMKITQVPGFPVLLREALLHVILAHHGKLEWGSAVMPMMPEALIVHAADLLDAQLFYMQEAEAQASEEFVWQRKLDDRRIFVRSDVIAPAASDAAAPLTSMQNAAPIASTAAPREGQRPAIPVLRFATAGRSMPEQSFETRRLPLIGSVAAGTPLAVEQSIEDYMDVEVNGLSSDPNTFLLRVRGESMAGDGIVDGDLVVVRPQEHHEPEDIVVALLRGDNEAAIKRVETHGGEVFLVSSNGDFGPIPIPDPGDLQVRGRVVARLRPAVDEDQT